MSPTGTTPAAPLLSLSTAADTVSKNNPHKVHDAAEQFEALLIGQILRSVRENGGGWLGEGDSAGSSATEFAEQHFATLLAKQGGLGLANMIARGLDRESTGK